MNTLKLTITVLLLSSLTGCSTFSSWGSGSSTPAASSAQASKFEAGKDQAPSAVENALMWSDKYAKLNEQFTTEKARSQLLLEDNNRLKDQNAQIKSQLDQAQKELTEANNLLIDMRKELNNWKTDVLGYRDEMRAAHKAQLEALSKVVNILGGETAVAAVADSNAPVTTQKKTNEPNQ